MNPLTKSDVTRRTERGLIILFIGLLWLPILDSIFHFDRAPVPNEKRLLAEYPKFPSDWRGLKSHLAGLELYFNDHFGFRKQLVDWHNHWKHDLFHDQSVRNALVGRDGWLYYTADQMFEHYLGVRQFTSQELRDWQTLLESRRDRLAQRGIKYLFVVAPGKQDIYPDFLPEWMAKMPKVNPQTKLDQLIAYMHDHSTVEVLDLRPALREARRIAPVYLQTDTHWNFLGGFIACQEVIKKLTKQLPQLAPLDLESFERKPTPAPGGDTAIYLGVKVVESNAVVFIPKTNLPALKMTANPLENPAYKEPAFTENSAAQINAVVFRDSFANAWEMFLGYQFRRTTYLWQYNLDAHWLNREKPAVVVNEMYERFFNIADPRELLRQDVWQ